MRTETPTLYDSVAITDAEKEAINNWYDLRRVCDNDNFVIYFKRVLNRDYGLFRELLRLEPSVSKYDWLVQQYMESQTYTQDTNTVNGQSTGSTSASNTGTSRTEGVTTSNGTHQGNETDSTTTGVTGTDTFEGTKESRGTTTTNRSETTTATETANSEAGGTDTTTSSRSTNNKTLTKDNPMSSSYAGGLSLSGGGTLDWTYPSGQGETQTTDSGTDSTAYGRTDETTRDTSGSRTGEDATTRSDTGTDESSRTTTSQTTTTGSKTSTSSDVVSGTNTVDVTNSGTATQTQTGTTATQNDGQHLTQHINTGRGVDTATLLTQATAFIQNSSAMAWLLKQLEPCFFGLYFEEDDDYYI